MIQTKYAAYDMSYIRSTRILQLNEKKNLLAINSKVFLNDHGLINLLKLMKQINNTMGRKREIIQKLKNQPLLWLQYQIEPNSKEL